MFIVLSQRVWLSKNNRLVTNKTAHILIIIKFLVFVENFRAIKHRRASCLYRSEQTFEKLKGAILFLQETKQFLNIKKMLFERAKEGEREWEKEREREKEREEIKRECLGSFLCLKKKVERSVQRSAYSFFCCWISWTSFHIRD